MQIQSSDLCGIAPARIKSAIGPAMRGSVMVAIEAGILTHAEVLASYREMQRRVRAAGAASIGLTLYPPYPAGAFRNPQIVPYSYQNCGDWTWFGA